jgi:hypothetical protein
MITHFADMRGFLFQRVSLPNGPNHAMELTTSRRTTPF